MPFIPDEQEKTVKIPIQVRGGEIQFYFDGPLPDLKESIISGTRLRCPRSEGAQAILKRSGRSRCLKKKTLLYVQLCDNRTPGYPVSVVAGHQSPYSQLYRVQGTGRSTRRRIA
jgi:hypothetical protein